MMDKFFNFIYLYAKVLFWIEINKMYEIQEHEM